MENIHKLVMSFISLENLNPLSYMNKLNQKKKVGSSFLFKKNIEINSLIQDKDVVIILGKKDVQKFFTKEAFIDTNTSSSCSLNNEKHAKLCFQKGNVKEAIAYMKNCLEAADIILKECAISYLDENKIEYSVENCLLKLMEEFITAGRLNDVALIAMTYKSWNPETYISFFGELASLCAENSSSLLTLKTKRSSMKSNPEYTLMKDLLNQCGEKTSYYMDQCVLSLLKNRDAVGSWQLLEMIKDVEQRNLTFVNCLARFSQNQYYNEYDEDLLKFLSQIPEKELDGYVRLMVRKQESVPFQLIIELGQVHLKKGNSECLEVLLESVQSECSDNLIKLNSFYKGIALDCLKHKDLILKIAKKNKAIGALVHKCWKELLNNDDVADCKDLYSLLLKLGF